MASLARSERGSAVVEMALAAPFLALLLIGMTDLGRAYSMKLQLEQIAQRSVEKVQNTDFNAASSDQRTALQAETASAAGVSTSAVTVSAWLECNNNGTKLGVTSSCTTAGDPYARYVEVQVTKDFLPMFPAKWFGTLYNGKYRVRGLAGVRVQ